MFDYTINEMGLILVYIANQYSWFAQHLASAGSVKYI